MFAWHIGNEHRCFLLHPLICPKRHLVYEQLLDTLAVASYALCDICKIVRNTHKTSFAVSRSCRLVGGCMRSPDGGGEVQRRRLLFRALVVTALGAVLLAGCSSGTSSSAKSNASSKGVAPLYSSLPSSVRKAGHIVAGSELSVPPMIFYESNGTTISGVNYDLGQAMSRYLGVPILWRQLSFPDLEPALSSGQIQMIFDVINDTPQREKVFNFIDYVHAGNALLVPHGNPLHITSLTSLCGHSIATVRGAVQIQLVEAASSTCASEGKGAITLRLYPSAPTARLQVQTGTVNAFIGNTPVLLYLARVSGSGKIFSAIPLAGHASYYGIAVSKSSQKLETALEKALEEVINSGAYMKILNKYGLQSIAISKPMINAAG